MRRLQNILRSLCGMVVFLVAATPLSAQQKYTLDQCIEYALQNNARSKNAGNDLSMAQHQRREAQTKYFPTISASGSGFLSSTHLIGLDLAPGMSMAMLKNGLVGGVTASMPLFTGGQIVQGNKMAQVNIEKYQLLRQQTENEVRLTTEQYFWQVVMLKEKLKTLSTVEAQLGRIQQDVDAAVKAGVTNRNDLLQVNLKQNDTQSTRLSVEDALALSRRLLAQYIGAEDTDIDVDFQVTDSLPPSPELLYRQPDESLPLTPEYNLLQAKLRATHLERKMTIGKNLPTIAIGGGFMYDNLLDRDRSYWLGFATVSVPLSGWWEGSHSMKRSKLAIRTEENNLKDGSELLVIRMQNTWDALNNAYRQVQIAMRSIQQSNENLRLHTDYYKAGTCTMSDLLEAQTLFQQSRDKYVEAWAQYEVKKREYLQATGR